MSTNSLKEQREVHTSLLLAGLDGNKPIPLDTKYEFGLATAAHERVLVAAVKAGKLSREDLIACCFDGKKLTERLMNESNPPLTFRTMDDFTRKHMSDAGVQVNELRRIETGRGSFVMEISNVIERWRADTLLDKEPETIAWLSSTIDARSVLFDVGANVGVFTLYAAHLDPRVQVIAFEPDPLNFARLNRNVHANAKYPARIVCFPIALHESIAVSRFFTSTFASGKAENWTERDRDQAWSMHTTGCMTVSLDELLRLAPLVPRPTHLKIDVDGPELSILRGATQTLAAPGLRHLLVELGERELEPANALLAPLGFEQTQRAVYQTIDGEDWGNVLFEKRV